MSNAHVWLKAYPKADTARGAGVQVRYLKREGEFAPVQYLKRTNATTKDYTDFVTSGTQHLPTWAEGDPQRFFVAAAAGEGANRYYMFQVQFSLPRELTEEQQHALREDLMAATMPDLPALWVMHNKQLDSGEMHPHIHILLSARKDDGIARDSEATFMRWNAKKPEQGGAQKDLWWSKSQAPEQLRQAFADLSNYHLERAGVAARVDPRALKRREIQRPALGRGTTQLDRATVAKEQAKASATWEHRKGYRGLGNVHAIPREEMVALVQRWTREHKVGQQLTTATAADVAAWDAKEEARQTQEIARREAELRQIARARRGELRAHELHELTQRGDDRVRHGLRARIFEDEQPGYRY
jgi:hypothetical protein